MTATERLKSNMVPENNSFNILGPSGNYMYHLL